MTYRRLGVLVAGCFVFAAAAYVGVRSARAVGVPADGALTYAGVLEDANGAPITGQKNIAVQVFDAASGGTKRCEVLSQSYTLVGGRFEIPLPNTCTSAVQGVPDLWLELLVDGASTGRAKLGAVPFAIEARRASESGGALKNEIGWKSVYGAALAGCSRLGALPPNAGTVVPRTAAQSCDAVCTAQATLKTCRGAVAVQIDDVNGAPAAAQSLGRHYEYACSNQQAGSTPIGSASPYGTLFGFCCCA
jgi:hypothetical protein